ncbi:MAG: MFS transporter, partial [Solirubrobacterales bacterium]
VAQALGGAAAVAGAIELLAASRGSHRAAAALWGSAGLAGLALGPAAGGLLTELLSWESIFAVQVPVVLIAGLARGGARGTVEVGGEGRLDLGPEIALALVSAGLTGALFLLVIMLTEGWLLSPLEAGLVVSAIPLATLASRPLAARVPEGPEKQAAGAILLAGGLAALGLLPEAGAAWTLAPQALVGGGLALSIPGLTDRALAGPDPGGHRAAGTIAARHLGVVAGIVALTPVFSADLDQQYEAVTLSGTALLLDAPLSPGAKLGIGEAVAEQVERADGRLPDVRDAFDRVEPEEGAEPAQAALETDLVDEVEKAATHAFSLSFLLAGAFAAAALAPIALGRRR